MSNTTGAENVELYWFMLELFTDHDTTKCGQVSLANFPPMMSELVKTAKKHGLVTPAEVTDLVVVSCVYNLTQDQYETILKKYDPRGNGTLTIDEWIKLATEEVFKPII